MQQLRQLAPYPECGMLSAERTAGKGLSNWLTYLSAKHIYHDDLTNRPLRRSSSSSSSSSSSPLRLGRWPVIPVRLSTFSSVDLGFSSLQGSCHVLSLLVDLLPFSICACSIRFFSFVPTMLCFGSHMFFRILSFLILSLLVLFIILLSVFISVTSNICIVFTVSVRVSAA